jgi:hypothetical protein
MLVAPWQYATINPTPVAKDATARIKGRSGLISNSSLVRRIFLLTSGKQTILLLAFEFVLHAGTA